MVMFNFNSWQFCTQEGKAKLGKGQKIHETDVDSIIAATQGGPEALFNVLDDPSETMDLQDNFPDVFEYMKVQFVQLTNELVERSHAHVDEISDGNGNLATGWCWSYSRLL